MRVYEVQDYDQSPQRDLVVASLMGTTLCSGQSLQPGLDALAREGIVGHPSIAVDDTGTTWWALRPTQEGLEIGLALATSAELVRILDVASALVVAGKDWDGVPLRRVASELDRRAGGDGEISWPEWMGECDRQTLLALPRRVPKEGE